ncbi:MAG: hypothetical protein KKA65_04670 [Nanoarchaeota archaeon]|nr:hypothetical protein [Nanoarchaeota archaeon]MBU4351887.1 hypothetical protein [Nanoarchaeota archaeon]MBU4456769.1 hypothetical protein [Nanoarchaeota archaeon]MCG2719660.1 DHHA1 domain-containing protein [Nanoarchaeota archaeon]
MITDDKIKEIRKLLNDSENPLFFFDDDSDGVCSYLLLKKYINRGKGIIVKSSPTLNRSFARKVQEYHPDRVFVLDKPGIEQEFVDDSKVQVVWIDHHPLCEIEGVHYFNPLFEDPKDNRPTSYWCYKVANQNRWLAMCGIIGDWFIPEFMDDFMKKYPDLVPEAKNPGQVLFETDFGKLVRIINFMLKGKMSDVKKSISVLEKIETPYEILNQETPKGKFLYKNYEKINKTYIRLYDEAVKAGEGKDYLFFTYPITKISVSGDLANELLHNFPEKLILIGREKESEVVISVRGMKFDLPKIIGEALEGLEGYGGGHKHAAGGCISKKDFNVFISRLKKKIKK